MTSGTYDKVEPTTNKEQRKKYWDNALGLQKVDNLSPSDYMLSLVNEHIEGKITYDEIGDQLKSYYEKNDNIYEEEADIVSLRIAKILEDGAFRFDYRTYLNYHKILFQGLDIGIPSKYIGNVRDYNISKKEDILNGDTVMYGYADNILETLKYDIENEKNVKYSKLNDDERVSQIARFTSLLWQNHVFGEGNTRTTAVFVEKYLISKGLNVDNELFKDNSLYFRNALVRANYSNLNLDVDETDEFLIKFFENLILGKNNVLDNEEMYITPRMKSMEKTR